MLRISVRIKCEFFDNVFINVIMVVFIKNSVFSKDIYIRGIVWVWFVICVYVYVVCGYFIYFIIVVENYISGSEIREYFYFKFFCLFCELVI